MNENPFYINYGVSYENSFDVKGYLKVETPKNIWGSPKVSSGGAPGLEGKINGSVPPPPLTEPEN